MAVAPPTQEEAPNCAAMPKARDQLFSLQSLWADEASLPYGLSEITSKLCAGS